MAFAFRFPSVAKGGKSSIFFSNAKEKFHFFVIYILFCLDISMDIYIKLIAPSRGSALIAKYNFSCHLFESTLVHSHPSEVLKSPHAPRREIAATHSPVWISCCWFELDPNRTAPGIINSTEMENALRRGWCLDFNERIRKHHPPMKQRGFVIRINKSLKGIGEDYPRAIRTETTPVASSRRRSSRRGISWTRAV